MQGPTLVSTLWSAGGDLAGDALPLPDVNATGDFQRWLREAPAASPSETTEGRTLGGLLNAASSSLHEQEHQLDKSLRRAARTGGPLDGLAVQRQLSQLYLSHGLVSKVIGKTTQALDQLAKLQ